MAEAFVANYKEMIESIQKYGGFYIGRYELSAEGVQKNKSTLTDANWYELYAICKDLNASDKVETQMVWGCQWDMACNFIASKGEKKSIVDSRSWGNYGDSVSPATEGNYEFISSGEGAKEQNTGSNENWKANNIYDLAGNCVEWTQETSNSNVYGRVYRGGDSRCYGSSGGACSRMDDDLSAVYVTTRPTLIIK